MPGQFSLGPYQESGVVKLHTKGGSITSVSGEWCPENKSALGKKGEHGGSRTLCTRISDILLPS
jgi:hypothetical protein